MSEATLPLDPLAAKNRPANRTDDRDAAETTPGGDEEVRWVVVKETGGILPAQIIAGSLQAAGIPAIAWQQGAGRALGLTVGLLGSGYVSVPQNYEEDARDFLATLDDLVVDWDEEDDEWAEDDADAMP